MPKIAILYLIQFIGIWINLFIGVMGMITYIVPVLQGSDPIQIELWFKYPLLLPVLYGLSIYMIVGAGRQLDNIAREREGG